MDQSIDLLRTRGLDPELASAIDEKVDEYAEWSFQYLERLVAAPSTVGQEQSALKVFEAEMRSLGFSIERLPIPDDVVSLPGSGIPMAPYTNRYDVIARRAADIDGASLLLNGHIDVVPADEPQLWTTPPFQPQRRDGWLYGRGAGDMKCGFAMGALALRAILDVDVEAALGPLTFVAAIEEEYTGNGTLASVDAGVLADAVVILEPTNLDLLLGAVGILWLEIEVEGRAAHAESAAMAVNAIEAALPLVATLHELEAELNSNPDPRIDAADPLHVNLGRFRGGDWPSSVPSVARLDIRVAFPLGWTPDQAEALVREHIARASARDPWLADHLPRIRCSGFRAEGYDLPHHHPLALSLAAAHRHAHGDDPATIRMASTTDARTYLNQAGVPAICYGPRTERIHGIDEGVELASILAGARTLARFLVAFPGSYRVP